MKWLGVAGSLRRRSLNRALLEAVRERVPAGDELVLFDGIGALPLFDADLPYDPPPAPVQAWKDALESSDGLLIATPEYNYSIPGVLKNALDWATRPAATSPLRRMPVGIMGVAAGMSGTMRAQYHLRQILVYTDCRVMNHPEVFVAHAHERFDEHRALTCPTTRAILDAYVVAFSSWVGLLAGERRGGSGLAGVGQ